MDEASRRGKGGGAKRLTGGKTSSSALSEAQYSTFKRPLRTFELGEPPEYKAPSNMLTHGLIEKEVQLAGVLGQVPVHLDATNRTEVLRLIDRGKRESILPLAPLYSPDTILSICVHDIKLTRRDATEELLYRVPIHEIAAASYIHEETQHILGLKFGKKDEQTDMCQLAILYCDTRKTAEELCALIQQCFELVFTEATMQYMEQKLREVSNGASFSSSITNPQSENSDNSTPLPDRRDLERNPSLAFLSQSRLDLENGSGNGSSMNSRTTYSRSHPHRRSSGNSKESSDVETTISRLTKDYMTKLQSKLSAEELTRFAMLLHTFRSQQMAVKEFCDRVLELYGPERKQLLLGLRPFVTESDADYFDKFLHKIGVNPAENSDTLQRKHSIRNSRQLAYARQQSEGSLSRSMSGSATAAVDEYDRILQSLSTEVNNMEMSVNNSGSDHHQRGRKS